MNAVRDLAALLALTSLCFQTSHAEVTSKRNLLHIHADDHRADGLHALGNPLLSTPHLDSLVEGGMTFTRCYTMGSSVGAVCLPSRTMMFTGRSWLRAPGRMNPAAAQVGSDRLLPSLMRKAGYETFHAGKGGNEFIQAMAAFDTNLIMDDHGPDLRRGSSERHADAAINFLKQHDKGKPFYMYIAPPVPHDPRVAAPEFHRMYDPEKIPLSAAFLPQHPWDNGEMSVRDEQLAPWPRTPQNTKQQLAGYYACITGLDHHVGRIFEQLKSTGEWDNTIIVFTGDNGLSMGDHGLFGKQNLYEFGGMHVPCVMAGPGIVKGRSGALIYLMDLFPTFCELGAAEIPEGVEGRSIVPLLHGEKCKTREVLYTAYRNCQRAVRNDRWKLIRYPQVDKTQLFDLQNDPHELINLAGLAENEENVREMMRLLKGEMKNFGDDCPLQIPNPQPADWSPAPNGSALKVKRADKKNPTKAGK